MAVRTLPIEGASIVLVSTAGHRTLLATTDERGAQLEVLSATCREGPAIDAVSDSHPVLAGALGDGYSTTRWPVFIGEALDLGVAAIFAVPLQIGVISLGAFVAYRATSGALVPTALSQMLRISDAAAYAVLDLAALTGTTSAQPAEGKEEAGGDAFTGTFVSAEVHQASGMLMVQLGLPIDAALARLRAHAFARERPLIDIAREVIARTLSFES